jgi:hypothetical protein
LRDSSPAPDSCITPGRDLPASSVRKG